MATVPAAAVGAMKTLQISSGWNIWINELGKELEQRVGERKTLTINELGRLDQRVGETRATRWGWPPKKVRKINLKD